MPNNDSGFGDGPMQKNRVNTPEDQQARIIHDVVAMVKAEHKRTADKLRHTCPCTECGLWRLRNE